MSVRINRAPRVPSGSDAGGGDPGIVSHISMGSKNNSPPPVDQELIDFLKRTFPVRLHESLNLRDYDTMLGSQKVIECLQLIHNQQQQKGDQ